MAGASRFKTAQVNGTFASLASSLIPRRREVDKGEYELVDNMTEDEGALTNCNATDVEPRSLLRGDMVGLQLSECTPGPGLTFVPSVPWWRPA